MQNKRLLINQPKLGFVFRVKGKTIQQQHLVSLFFSQWLIGPISNAPWFGIMKNVPKVVHIWKVSVCCGVSDVLRNVEKWHPLTFPEIDFHSSPDLIRNSWGREKRRRRKPNKADPFRQNSGPASFRETLIINVDIDDIGLPTKKVEKLG
jgi:hypothetical protein